MGDLGKKKENKKDKITGWCWPQDELELKHSFLWMNFNNYEFIEIYV